MGGFLARGLLYFSDYIKKKKKKKKTDGAEYGSRVASSEKTLQFFVCFICFFLLFYVLV